MNSDQTRRPRPGSGVRGVSVLSAGKPGRWRVSVFAGYRADGTANRGYFRFKGTKREATDAGIVKRDQIANQPYDPDRHTVGSWFDEVFIPQKRMLADRGMLSPTTVDGIEKKFLTYIKPHPIAALPLRKIDATDGPAHLARWFSDVASSPGKQVERLSQRTLSQVLAIMMMSLRHAVAVGLLEKDPVRRFPSQLKPKPAPKGRPSERSVGSAGVRALRQAFAGSDDEAAIVLALVGLRRGEIVGVPLDYDPERGGVVLDGPRPFVRVRQVVIYARGVGAAIKSYPKSETSRRDVALPTWAVEPLRRQKRRVLEMRLAAGEAWLDHGLLFPSRGRHRHPRTNGMVGEGSPGQPQNPNALYKRFKAQLRAAGLEGFDPDRVERIRLHDLRHTFVSTLVNEGGMRAEEVQRLAGHAHLTTTLGYRAEDTEAGARAAAALEDLGRLAGD